MNYFNDCFDIESIKKRYRRLCFKHHPDRGGDVREMQQINEAYHSALQHMDGRSFARSDSKGDYTYNYDRAREQAVMDKIDELIKANLEGCKILLIGVWVWVTGDTRPHRKALKAAGLKWHGKRRCWYWREYGRKHRGKPSRGSLARLAARYGAREFSREQQEKDNATRSYPATA